MNSEKNKKDRNLYVALFSGLFLFFVIIRLPYDDIKMWGLEKACRAAGIELYASHIGFSLPLALEMKDVSFQTGRNEEMIVMKDLERIRVGVSLLPLIWGERKVSLGLEKKGTTDAMLVLSGKGQELSVKARDFDVSGLSYGGALSIESGMLTASGSLKSPGAMKKAEGKILLSFIDMSIRGLSPLLPELRLDRVDVEMEKAGDNIELGNISIEMAGLSVKGKGKAQLREQFEKSTLNIDVDVDASAYKKELAPDNIKTYLDMAVGLAGGSERAKVSIAGELTKPGVSVNGKSFF